MNIDKQHFMKIFRLVTHIIQTKKTNNSILFRGLKSVIFNIVFLFHILLNPRCFQYIVPSKSLCFQSCKRTNFKNSCLFFYMVNRTLFFLRGTFSLFLSWITYLFVCFIYAINPVSLSFFKHIHVYIDT